MGGMFSFLGSGEGVGLESPRRMSDGRGAG